MEKLIKRYIKKDDPETLHDLRVYARKVLSNLEKEGKIDLGLKELLKKSSKLRDTDVLLEICKNKKAKKYLKQKHKKLRKKFLKWLKDFKSLVITLEPQKHKEISLKKCKEILSESFLNKDEKSLHKIRIEIKKCRYTNPKYEKKFKLLQDTLGKMHDYYNCERLLLKLNQNPKTAVKKKLKWLKKAEKKRIKVLKALDS